MSIESVGIARMKQTAINLPAHDLIRLSGVIRDEPFAVRHAMNIFGRNRLPAPIIYWYIRNRGLMIQPSGANSQYGDGAYAWPAGFPIQRGPYIDLLILPGSLVEEIRPAGKQHFYRLLPHSGKFIQVEVVGTNLSDQAIEEWREFSQGG